MKGMLLILVALIARGAFAQSVILFDFEEGTEGWEHEHANPTPAGISRGRAKHGNASLSFEHTFGPKTEFLHVRVKDGFPRDYSTPSFLGFSAWVFIPPGPLGWEALMFARTDDEWKWNAGRTLKDLQPGWHRVQILREEIENLEKVQDVGVQVINIHAKTTARVLIDQVEAIMDESVGDEDD